MANSTTPDSMLTIKEASHFLHVHPNTLRRWGDMGRLRVYRINSRGDRRFKRVDITNFIAECKNQL